MQEHNNQDTILDALTSYWTDRAKSYSVQNIAEMNDWRREAWRKLILSHAPQKEVLRVLDIGTGPDFLPSIWRWRHEVTAVDVTEEMLQYAKSNAEVMGQGWILFFTGASFFRLKMEALT